MLVSSLATAVTLNNRALTLDKDRKTALINANVQDYTTTDYGDTKRCFNKKIYSTGIVILENGESVETTTEESIINNVCINGKDKTDLDIKEKQWLEHYADVLIERKNRVELEITREGTTTIQ